MNTIRRSASFVRPESLAFLPQLLVSAVAIPIALAEKDLASTMFAQTFAFVMFNKVCTSQVGTCLISTTTIANCFLSISFGI